MVLVRVVFQYQPIILIGRQQAFTPPQAAHDQQGEGHRRRAMIRQGFRQNAPMQIKVDAIDQAHHRLGAQPLGQ